MTQDAQKTGSVMVMARPQLKAELAALLSDQLSLTQRGYTLNGQELLRRGISFALPQSDEVAKWVEQNWSTFEADGLALAEPGNTWADVTKLVADVVNAFQTFKSAGIPGLAREDVAASVVAWLAEKFGRQMAERTGRPLPWYWGLFASTILPSIIKAAWRKKFG